jgi:hypothetical protein
MANPHSTPTCRTVITGTAAGLVAGTAVNAAAVADRLGADPIFAAISRHRAANAVHAAVCLREDDDDESWGRACDAAFHALAELVAITPTTLAGCVAMLRYIDHITHPAPEIEEGALFAGYTRVQEPARDLLSRLADRIETQS